MLFGTIRSVFCVFFCCLFVLAPGTVFYRFLCDFEDIFGSISGVFWSKVEVVFFATLLSKTMIFKVPGLLLFSIFLQSFPHSIPDLIFMVFLVILGSLRLPFWSLWAWFFDIKKKSRKRVCGCLRLFASIREYLGGAPLNKITFLQKQLFNISSLQQCLRARWRKFVNHYLGIVIIVIINSDWFVFFWFYQHISDLQDFHAASNRVRPVDCIGWSVAGTDLEHGSACFGTHVFMTKSMRDLSLNWWEEFGGSQSQA